MDGLRFRRLAVAALAVIGLGVTPAAASWPDDHAGRCVSKAANGPGRLVGTNGRDCLAGSNGPDTVIGKAGDDVIAGNHGKDVLRGGSGDDRLWGGRGPDTFRCGPGFDVVHNARSTGADSIADDCEVVKG